MESSSKKSSPLCNQRQASQSGEGLVNRGQNQTWHGVGVESSSRKSSPPPRKEFLATLQNNQNTSPPPCYKFLAAPQTTGIPRRPPVENSSPPPKQPEYLAAPVLEIPRRPRNNRNSSPPPSQKKMRKTPVAYPWNPLVAPGMGEANWWQPSAPNTIRNFARVNTDYA